MEVISFPTPGLGDQSYLLVHEGRGVLVDPQRDIGRFLDAAAERDVELRFVLETHLHNDYVSGGGQAASRTGAELVLPAAAAAAYPYTPAFHLEDIPGGGGLTIRPLHTPGHTPEHTSYLVLVDDEPAAVFSGGSLLVSAAGRPDLLGPERARPLARLQYGSLHRLAALSGEVDLFPTHGEGSFCSSTGVGRHTSTIADERRGNPLLALSDAETFADELLADPMPIPAFYAHVGPVNLLGAPAMPAGRLPEIPVEEIPRDARVVDIRPRAVQAAGFLPGSTGVALGDDFGSWVGWLVPYGAAIVLVAEPGQDVTEALTQLARVGIDDVRGIVRDLGRYASARFELLDLTAFLGRLPGARVLDVRMPGERRAEPLPGAVERFLPDLVSQGLPGRLRGERRVPVVCGSGRRAAIAATILTRHGLHPVVLDGAGAAQVAEALATRGGSR